MMRREHTADAVFSKRRLSFLSFIAVISEGNGMYSYNLPT